ncbi:MAG TPA: hypothetical protein VIH27_05135 [Nitrososphaerales archaeon]
MAEPSSNRLAKDENNQEHVMRQVRTQSHLSTFPSTGIIGNFIKSNNETAT